MNRLTRPEPAMRRQQIEKQTSRALPVRKIRRVNVRAVTKHGFALNLNTRGDMFLRHGRVVASQKRIGRFNDLALNSHGSVPTLL